MSVKIVRLSPGGHLDSCRVWDTKFNQRYIVGKWVEPLYGPALVFDTIGNALEFHRDTIMGFNADTLYHCKTVNRRLTAFIKRWIEDESMRYLLDLWDTILNRELSDILPHGLTLAPPGTYTAKRVMLTRKIGLASDLIRERKTT